MPQLFRQPVASTALDAHGERLSLEELRSLFNALPAELVINDEHDLTLPSVATAKNFQFIQLESSEWAIVADIDVHDEALFAKRGGFSIAWLAATYTTNPDREPDIEILFNPRLFREDLAIALAGLSDDDVNIVGRELKQRGLDPTAILIVKFVATSALSGFIGKVGSDLYDKMLSRLCGTKNDLRDSNAQPPLLQFIVPRHLNPYQADIFVELIPEQLEALRVGSLSFEDAIETAKLVPHTEQARKIVVKAVGDPPTWQLTRYEKSSGLQVKI